MEKYKVCPICGCHNLPTLIECIECEADLTSVGAVDNKIESINTDDNKTVNNKMVRICDNCGTYNAASDRKCSECGEDISDITPGIVESDNKVKYVLSSFDGEYTYELIDKETVVGRKQIMKEYLSSKFHVSRIHAKFIISDESLLLQNMSKTNYTYLNNEKIGDEPCIVKDGDEIGLGGCISNGSRQNDAAYFIVRIGKCI